MEAAKALTNVIKKVTSAKIPINTAEHPEARYIRLGTIADKGLVERAKIDPLQLRPDGFAFTADDRDVCIVGADPRGVTPMRSPAAIVWRGA